MLGDWATEGSVREAEMRMAAFLNLSFNLMDHFSDFLSKLCPDSRIAAQFNSKRTKTKCTLAPHFHQELVQKLWLSRLSSIIDETTDVSTRKELAVVTRRYGESMTIECSLYDLLEVSHSDAESLFQALVGIFVREGIPFDTIIGFAADNTNVMFSKHNSAASCLKEKIPDIFIFLMQCICHSAHLCASYACDKLPRTAENFFVMYTATFAIVPNVKQNIVFCTVRAP